MLSLTPELLVEDIQSTLTWYRDILGFETLFISPESGMPSFARIKRGGVEIMLFRRAEFSAEIPTFSSTPMGGSIVLYLEVKNIQSEWSKLDGKAKIIQPLHSTTYGSEEFTIQDCNGYHLMFGQRNS